MVSLASLQAVSLLLQGPGLLLDCLQILLHARQAVSCLLPHLSQLLHLYIPVLSLCKRPRVHDAQARLSGCYAEAL